MNARTIRPGEMNAADLGESAEPRARPSVVTTYPGSTAEQVGAVVAREAFARLAEMSKQGGTGGLWVAVPALGVAVMILGGAFGAHLIGDGTQRDAIEWLVERAIAEDAGQPPPPLPYRLR